jgi:signal peptidase I
MEPNEQKSTASENTNSNEELREWLGLKPADLLVYIATGAIIAMYFVSPPIDLIFAIGGVVFTLAACPIGMRSSPSVSRFTNRAKKVAYPSCVAIALVFIFFHFLNSQNGTTSDVTYYQIPQNGMYPGLPAGSRFLALRRPYSNPSEIARGDIVIFKRNVDGQEYTFIWRVIGLPNEGVRSSGDSIFVNNKELKRVKIRSSGEMEIFEERNGDALYEVAYPKRPGTEIPPEVDLTIPQGHFFVLGDNRHNALDSRYFGPIPFNSIIAKKK